MNTKHILKVSLLLMTAPLALISFNAQAAGTASPNSIAINFLGAVQGTTCSGISVAGGNTINFGSVAPSAFAGKGTVGATQPVTINLTGCGFTNVTKVTPQLIASVSTSDIDAIANGLADIGAAVELYDADNTTHLDPNQSGTPITVVATATTAQIPLIAKFVQETATTPTPGNYQATTIIALTYS